MTGQVSPGKRGSRCVGRDNVYLAAALGRGGMLASLREECFIHVPGLRITIKFKLRPPAVKVTARQASGDRADNNW